MTAALNVGAGSPAGSGVAHGSARTILRLEGAAAFAASATLYAHAGFSWPLFAVLFLAPDLAMLGYLINPWIGAAVYNVAHTYALALPLALFGFLDERPIILALALIWIAHIGFDRALGYGLKYPTRFGDSHLGRVGRSAASG
jgi:Domain of unknown function (DUF4260)